MTQSVNLLASFLQPPPSFYDQQHPQGYNNHTGNARTNNASYTHSSSPTFTTDGMQMGENQENTYKNL